MIELLKEKMKQIIIILAFLLLGFVNLYSQSNPNRTYQVRYFITNTNNIVADNSTLIITSNRITLQHKGYKKYWECKYKGVRIHERDRNVSFKYHYYLTDDNLKLIISDYPEVKHNGVFYYRIVFNGQTLLAL